jgi:SAM-dependent methyltransferase
MAAGHNCVFRGMVLGRKATLAMNRRNTFKISGPSEQFIVPILEREIIDLFNAIDSSTSIKVLDIGCGNQPLRNVIEERGWSYKSMDVSQNDLLNVDIIGKIDEELTTTEKFDLLIVTEVMEHVLHWEKAFENFRELCKPKGKILITCPFFYPLHEVPYDFWRPTSYALKSFALEFGFLIIRQVQAGNIWDVLGTLLNSVRITRAKETTVIGKVKLRLLLMVVRLLRRQMETKRISQYANAEGQLYLSNLILLEKN